MSRISWCILACLAMLPYGVLGVKPVVRPQPVVTLSPYQLAEFTSQDGNRPAGWMGTKEDERYQKAHVPEDKQKPTGTSFVLEPGLRVITFDDDDMPDHGPFSPDANPFLATSLFLPTVASCADYCARLPTCTDANYQTESKFCEIFISRADKEPVQTVHTERNEKYTRIQKVVAGASLLYTTAAPAKALRLWNRDMSGTDPVIPPPNYQHPAWNVTKPNTFSIENYPRFCWNEDEDPENGVLGSCGFGAVAEHASCQILCRYGYVPSRRAFTCVSMTGFDTPTIRDIVMRAPAQDPPRCIPVLDDEYHVALQMVPPAGVRDGTKGNLPFPIPVVPFSKIRKSIPQANQHVWEMVTSALEQETWQWIRDAPRIHPSAPNAPKLDFLWKRQYRRDRDGRVKWLDAVEPSSATHDALTADWPPRVIILNLLHRPERFHATLAELQAIGYPMDRVYRMEGVRADVGYAGWYASIMLILPWVAQQVDWENFLFLEDDVKWIGELDDTVQNINKLGRLIYPQNDADMSVRDDSGFDRWDSVSLGGTNVQYSATGYKDLFLKRVLGHQCATAWLVNTAFIPQLMHLYSWGIQRHRILPFRDFFADQIWVALMRHNQTNWFMTYPTPWAQQRPGVSDHRQQEVEGLGAIDSFKHQESEI